MKRNVSTEQNSRKNIDNIKQHNTRKKTLDEAQRKHRAEFKKNIDNIKQHDTREFWRLLNARKNTTQPNLDFSKLVSFCKRFEYRQSYCKR